MLRGRHNLRVIALCFLSSIGPSVFGFAVPAHAEETSKIRARAIEAFQRGEYRTARDLAELSLLNARDSRNRLDQAQALSDIGNASFYLSDYDSAFESFRASLGLFQEMEDHYRATDQIKNIAITHTMTHDLDRAMALLEQVIERSEREGWTDLYVSGLSSLGSVYRRLGAFRLAAATFDQELEVATRERYAEGIADAWIRKGHLYLIFGRPRKALEHFDTAADNWPKDGSKPHAGWLLIEKGRAYEELGRSDAAIRAYRRFLEMEKRSGHTQGMIRGHTYLGRVYEKNDPDRARQHYERALELAKGMESVARYAPLAGLAGIYLTMDEVDRAIDLYSAAVEELESFRAAQSSAQDKLAITAGNQWIYKELIHALLERNREGEDEIRAFHTLERARSRVLLETMIASRLEVERELAPELRDRERELTIRLRQIRSHLENRDLNSTDRKAILAELARSELESEELLLAIRRHSPRYASLHYPAPLSVEESQALLDDQSALVSFSVSDRHVLAFVLTADAFFVDRMPITPKVLRQQVENYVELLARDSLGWIKVGKRLFRDLIEPWRARLPPQIDRLVIIPDKELEALPFETLIRVGGPSIHRMLIEDFSISYALSSTLLAELGRRGSDSRSDRPRAILLFADPELESSKSMSAPMRSVYEEEGHDFGRVPYSLAEARAVESYARTSTRIYAGANASESVFKHLDLEPFSVVHFATHGLISRNHPNRSALLLTPDTDLKEDGFLQAREISRLRLPADLVVLSACRTARGRPMAGEGIQGLAQAFFHAGARSVLATLWDIEDAPTAYFIERFYHHLSLGKSKSESLRTAKLDLISRDGLEHPSRWAGFILIGEPDGIIDMPRPEISAPWWWAAFGALSILLMAAALRVLGRRRA